MVHMFPIFSIYYFLLFSYVFLHLRLRSQSFFLTFFLICIKYHHLYSLPPNPISTFRFQSHSNPSRLSLRTYKNAPRISARIHLLCGSAASKSPSQFTQGLWFRITVFVNSAPSVLLEVSLLCGSTSISRSPSLLKLQKMPPQLHSKSCLLFASGKVVAAQDVETVALSFLLVMAKAPAARRPLTAQESKPVQNQVFFNRFWL